MQRRWIHALCTALVLMIAADCAFAQTDDIGGGRLKLRRAIERVTQTNLALSGSLAKVPGMAAEFSKQLRGGASTGASQLTPDATQSYTQRRLNDIDQQLQGQSKQQALQNSNANSDLAMIALQSLVSQRQQAIEIAVQLLQTLGQADKAIAGNIDGGKNAGSGARASGPCGKACAAFINELLSADRQEKLRALKAAVAEYKSAAQAQASAKWDFAGNKLQDSLNQMLATQQAAYMAAVAAVIPGVRASIGLAGLMRDRTSSVKDLTAALQKLKKEKAALIQKLIELEAEVAGLELGNAEAALKAQAAQAMQDCIAAIDKWAQVVATAGGEAGGAIAGAIEGFAVGGPVGAVVGAVVGAETGGAVAGAAEAAAALAACELWEALLAELQGLEEQIAKINDEIAKLTAQLNSVEGQIAKTVEKIRQEAQKAIQRLHPSASSDTAVRGASASVNGATAKVATPCGGPSNPCNRPGRNLLAPGLLEGGGGFGTQGPAATGVPALGGTPAAGGRNSIR